MISYGSLPHTTLKNDCSLDQNKCSARSTRELCPHSPCFVDGHGLRISQHIIPCSMFVNISDQHSASGNFAHRSSPEPAAGNNMNPQKDHYIYSSILLSSNAWLCEHSARSASGSWEIYELAIRVFFVGEGAGLVGDYARNVLVDILTFA